MNTMKLAGAAWAYVGASLPESAAIFQALGVQAMDLIAAPGALLDSQEIERDPQGQARRVTEAGLPLSNLLYVFGDGVDDRPLNSADDTVRAAYRETFERVAPVLHRRRYSVGAGAAGRRPSGHIARRGGGAVGSGDE